MLPVEEPTLPLPLKTLPLHVLDKLTKEARQQQKLRVQGHFYALQSINET